MKKFLVLSLLLMACGEKSTDKTETNKKTETVAIEKPVAADPHTLNKNMVGMLDPLYARFVYENPYYNPNPVNPAFIKAQKIRSMKIEQTDFESVKTYEFDKEGNLIHFVECGMGKNTDTTDNIVYSYENGKPVSINPVGGKGFYTYTIEYVENTKTVKKYDRQGTETERTDYEYNNAGDLVKCSEFMDGRLFSICLYITDDITEKLQKEKATEYAKEMAGEKFGGLNLVQMVNGFPVKNVEVNADGTVFDPSVTKWEYDSKGRIINYSAPTMGGGAQNNLFFYNEKGMLVKFERSDTPAFEPVYEFYK